MTVWRVVALFLVTAYAFYLRYLNWLAAGGLESNYLDWATKKYFGGIASAYLSNAQLLYEGRFADLGYTYPLGYPAFMALTRMLGFDPQAHRLAQAGLDALGCVLAYAIVRALGAGSMAGFFAAGVYATAPWWAWGSGLIMAKSLLPLLMLATLFAFAKLRACGDGKLWFIVGAGIGLIPQIRADMSLLVIPLGLWALIQGGPAWSRRSMTLVCAVAGFATPWIWLAGSAYSRMDIFFGTYWSRGLARYRTISATSQTTREPRSCCSPWE